jgi:hypothetical protein
VNNATHHEPTHRAPTGKRAPLNDVGFLEMFALIRPFPCSWRARAPRPRAQTELPHRRPEYSARRIEAMCSPYLGGLSL